MRARNIKPGFFKNELLGTEDPLVSILFIGLWCLADKEGILEDRPLRIKAEIFPYREKIDVNRYLTVIQRLGFICRYKHNNLSLIKIHNFKKHQNPHHTEKGSDYPQPTTQTFTAQEDIMNNGELTVKQPLLNGELTDTLLLIPDSLIPDSLIPDSIKDICSKFDIIWKLYPSRVGKKAALKHFKASVKEEKDYLDIQKALDNYLSSERVKKGILQNGSTWFNNWRDWIDYQEPKPKTQAARDKELIDKLKKEDLERELSERLEKGETT